MPQPEVFVQHLRQNPALTLEQVRLMFNPELLRSVRVCDLLGVELIDQDRLTRASESTGADFDAEVLEVLCEAGHEVAAAYLRERVGGPRWKLQASLGRLVKARLVERRGTTSSTRYRATKAAKAA